MVRLFLWLFGLVISLALLFVLFWKFWFLRQPERDIPRTGIVSPASGRLVRIIRFEHGEPLNIPKGKLAIIKTLTDDVSSSGYALVIRLTPLDVHYQRAPAPGTVVAQAYRRGKFKNAVLKAGELVAIENEKNEILFETEYGPLKVIQVAGVAARRIESYVKKGTKVVRGEVIGLINFGSQVILVLPEGELLVKEGQTMIDGETVVRS